MTDFSELGALDEPKDDAESLKNTTVITMETPKKNDILLVKEAEGTQGMFDGATDVSATITPTVEHPPIPIETTKYPLQTMQKEGLPTISEVNYKLAVWKHVKKNVVSKEDYENIRGKPYLKASGCDKYIHFYRLNLSYINRRLYKDDEGYHYEVDAVLNAPWNQVVEGHGTASMKTMTLTPIRHNMIALAETRAKARAVRAIMGLEEPGYAEMYGQEPIKRGNTKNTPGGFD